jgi:hypothetical protein
MTAFRYKTIWLLSLVAFGFCHPAIAQPPVPGALTTNWSNATVPGTAGTNNWSTSGNWSGGLPDVTFNDFGVVDNGGVAYVNSTVVQQVGGVSLGTNAGQSGTLDILSGGSLTLVDARPAYPADGSVRVGQGGAGHLFVRSGGSLTSVSLMLGGANAASSMALEGTAMVTTGPVTFGATTRVTGPSVNFSASGDIAFQSSSVFIPEITSATHSALKTPGTAVLGGTLQVDFNGVNPAAGNAWNLIDAATIGGSFGTILPDPQMPLGLGQVLGVRTVNGGTNGKLAQLFVQQLPVLSINRDTGTVSITNPGASGIPLDGYTIQSTNGALVQANWQSLQTHPAVAGAGWSEANPTANRLSELRSSSNSTLGGGAAWGLGNIFHEPTPAQFGQNLEDVVFQYNDPTTQTTVNGVVNYTGSAGIDNLVLFADPATGDVKIRNTSPFTVSIDGYTIASAAGSLNSNPALWNSLQDQPGVAGATWAESNLSDNRVSELKSGGTTTLTMNGGTTFDLGNLFKTASPKDLVFQFLLSDKATANTGAVVYEAASAAGGVLGDYNKNGVVDAADYTVWRDKLGQPAGSLDNRDPLNGGNINAQDYTYWKSRFGATSNSGGGGLAGSTSVPEPATWLLLLLVPAIASARRRDGARR